MPFNVFNAFETVNTASDSVHRVARTAHYRLRVPLITLGIRNQPLMPESAIRKHR